MKKIKATLSSYTANRIYKKEHIILETYDKSSKSKREFLIQILEVTSDVPRCSGCGIRLDNKGTYKYKTGVYCNDCYLRRKNKQN